MTSSTRPGPFKILSVGEILWDLFPTGKKLGGAPANFAWHCRQLGADARLLSRVGTDALGTEALDVCRNADLATDWIPRDADHATGTVDVALGPDGQPTYTIVENVAWDFLEPPPTALDFVSGADALCFGSLAMRSPQNRRTLQTLLDAASPKILRVLDLNLRPPFCDKAVLAFVLDRADVLKLNDEELDRVAKMFGLEEHETDARLRELRAQYGFRLIALTRGSQGGSLTTETEQIEAPGIEVEIVDTVGAGDAFAAAVLVGFLSGRPLGEILRHANALGAYLCTQAGGMPEIPEELT